MWVLIVMITLSPIVSVSDRSTVFYEKRTCLEAVWKIEPRTGDNFTCVFLK
jgi:hypothetical protein